MLEVACGTGIVTERLVRRLAGQGTLVATDLNDAMIAHARARIPADPALEWRQADGTSLPFPDRAFDVVVCEFGLMFFPDKAAGVREAFRVLRPGGVYLFNVWDERSSGTPSPGSRTTRSARSSRTIRPVLRGSVQPPRHRGRAGACSPPRASSTWRGETVAKVGTSPSAADAATGLVEGNPVIGAIMARRPDALPDIRAAVARNIAAELGDHPVRTPLRAHVFTGVRP